MPKLPEYDVPSAQAKLRPSPDAEAAFETAARRIGPLMNQAGQDYREIGRVQATTIRAQDFPLDFTAFGNQPQGTNFRVEGGVTGFGGGGHQHEGGGVSGGGRSRSARAADRGQAGDPVHHAAELINTLDANTPAFGGGPTILRGNQSSGSPSIINTSPYAPVDKGLNYEDPSNGHVGPAGVQPYASKDTSVPPEGYLQDQANRYSVAPPVKLDAPEGYSSAPSGGSAGGGSFWSDLGNAVGTAISTGIGGADASFLEGLQ